MSYAGMPAKSSSGILQAFASASSKKVGSQVVFRQAVLVGPFKYITWPVFDDFRPFSSSFNHYINGYCAKI